MKKCILLLAVATAMSLQAQDTVRMKGPKDTYFSRQWMDTTGVYNVTVYQYPRASAVAKQFFTPDTLQVYGIAAILVNKMFTFHPTAYFPDAQSYLEYYYPDDPTLEHCQESLRLYQYYGDAHSPVMRQVGSSLPVHTVYTPVSYWLRMDLPPSTPYVDTTPWPVYERYFETPQAVFDTFYAGFTQSDGYYNGDHQWRERRPSVGCACFSPGHLLYLDYDEGVAALQRPSWEEPLEWHYYNTYRTCAYFLFPILTPGPPSDTTLAASTPGGMDLYVAVQPNPAHERVAVTSSFGLTAIEVYDSRGRQLLSAPASGFKVTLDISAWSRGTYLLRILTPLGPTTRKVIVQ